MQSAREAACDQLLAESMFFSNTAKDEPFRPSVPEFWVTLPDIGVEHVEAHLCRRRGRMNHNRPLLELWESLSMNPKLVGPTEDEGPPVRCPF